MKALSKAQNLATFRERIAKLLCWSVKDTYSFSLPTLRELVKDKDPALAAQLSDFLKSGQHFTAFDSFD